VASIKDTTIGRAMVWEIVPEGLPFELVDAPGQEGDLQADQPCYRVSG
jgi:DNA-directed RNA polymerase subunit beta'